MCVHASPRAVIIHKWNVQILQIFPQHSLHKNRNNPMAEVKGI